MNLSPKRMIEILKQHGYYLDRVKGSHHIYYNDDRKRAVPVPLHGSKDLKKGTFLAILKQAGIDRNEAD